MFIVAIVMVIVRGMTVECGCFGTADATRVGGLKLAENLLLTGTAIIASLRLR